LKYFGKTPNGLKFRGVGVELEIDRGYHNADAEIDCADSIKEILGERVYFNRDGSLDYGFEIITQPHTLREFFSLDWDSVLNACKENGYTSHDNGNCGLHFHISREAFGSTKEKQDLAIAKLLQFFDCYYNDIVKISRRDISQARRWAGDSGATTKDNAKKVVKGEIYRDRYHAVNLTNRNTVEIRIMRGTLNTKTFLACADFVTRLPINAKRITWRNCLKVSEWLKGCKQDTLDYIKERGAFENLFN
jgi:hypothetical protein